MLAWREERLQAARFPRWQFDADGQVLAGREEVLEILHADERLDEWGRILFLLQEKGALGDRRPLDLLRAGKLKAVGQAQAYEKMPMGRGASGLWEAGRLHHYAAEFPLYSPAAGLHRIGDVCQSFGSQPTSGQAGPATGRGGVGRSVGGRHPAVAGLPLERPAARGLLGG